MTERESSHGADDGPSASGDETERHQEQQVIETAEDVLETYQ